MPVHMGVPGPEQPPTTDALRLSLSSVVSSAFLGLGGDAGAFNLPDHLLFYFAWPVGPASRARISHGVCFYVYFARRSGARVARAGPRFRSERLDPVAGQSAIPRCAALHCTANPPAVALAGLMINNHNYMCPSVYWPARQCELVLTQQFAVVPGAPGAHDHARCPGTSRQVLIWLCNPMAMIVLGWCIGICERIVWPRMRKRGGDKRGQKSGLVRWPKSPLPLCGLSRYHQGKEEETKKKKGNKKKPCYRRARKRGPK